MAQSIVEAKEDEGPCWGKAFHCPTSTSNGAIAASTSSSASSGVGSEHPNKTTCEAWYRCDGVSNYIINWRCHGPSGAADTASLSSSPSSKVFKPSSFLKCDNSSSSRRMDTKLCPPPVVCPGIATDLNKNGQVAKDDAIDVDIILSVVLAIFACLLLVMMSVVAYKRWMARRRYRRRFDPLYHHHRHRHQHQYHHNHRPDRPYRALTTSGRAGKYNKSSSWFPNWTGLPATSLRFVGKSGSVNGIPYTDVYVPSKTGPGTLLHRQQHRIDHFSAHNHNNNNNSNSNGSSNNRYHHHLDHYLQHYNGNNNNNNNNSRVLYRTASRSPKLRSKVKRAGKIHLHGDRSVLTGSFKYQASQVPPIKTFRNSFNNKDRKSVSSRKDMYSPKGNTRKLVTAHSFRVHELRNARNGHSVRSPSFLHFDRHGGEFYFKGNSHENYNKALASPNPVRYYVSSPTPEYHSIISDKDTNSSDNSTSDFKNPAFPQVSSIQIPSYENGNKTDKEKASTASRFPYSLSKKYNLLMPADSYDNVKDPYLNYGYHGDTINNHADHDAGSEVGSWKSMSSVSPYALGRVHCKDGCAMSEAASIASKNWQYTVFGQQQSQHHHHHHHHHHQQQQQQKQQQNTASIDNTNANFAFTKSTDIVRASSMKDSSNHFISKYFDQATTNSPDVISSHNLSRHVTHVNQDGGSTHQLHHHHQMLHHHHHRHTDNNSSVRQLQQQQQHQHHHHQPIQQEFVARITVPGYSGNNHNQPQSESRTHEIDGNISNRINEDRENHHSVISRNYTQRVHIPGNVHDTWNNGSNAIDYSGSGSDGNDKAVMSQELSYDCFRNEHLRQLARQQMIASSSTLDKTVGQLSTKNIRVIPCLY